jgi:hypothetical protein
VDVAAELSVKGFPEMIAKLQSMSVAVEAACRDVVTQGALQVQRSTLAHMGSRPGPMVITGTLARSVRLIGVTGDGKGTYSSTVAPTTKYGRRIELGFGFHGTLGIDSLGRRYHQIQYPSLGPGLADATPLIYSLARRTFAEALGR